MTGLNDSSRLKPLVVLRKPLQAELILLAVAFVWGATFTIVKEAIVSVPPFSFLGIRFLLASAFLGIALFCRPKLRNFLSHNLLSSGFFLGLWLFIAYSVQTLGLQYTSAGRTGFITGLSVCLVPFFAMAILRKRPSYYAFLGVVLAAGGLAFLFLSPNSLAVNWGDALVGLCAIAFAIHIVLVSKYADRHHPLLLGWVQLFTVAVLNLVAAFFFEPFERIFVPDVILQPKVLQAILITSIFASVLAYVAQIYCQQHTSPARAAIMFSAEPVFAILTAYLWAGELLTGWNIFGCVLILSGMLLPEVALRPRSSPSP